MVARERILGDGGISSSMRLSGGLSEWVDQTWNIALFAREGFCDFFGLDEARGVSPKWTWMSSV